MRIACCVTAFGFDLYAVRGGCLAELQVAGARSRGVQVAVSGRRLTVTDGDGSGLATVTFPQRIDTEHLHSEIDEFGVRVHVPQARASAGDCQPLMIAFAR